MFVFAHVIQMVAMQKGMSGRITSGASDGKSRLRLADRLSKEDDPTKDDPRCVRAVCVLAN